jgi:caffeoyl-CoA O-methyltransferase
LGRVSDVSTTAVLFETSETSETSSAYTLFFLRVLRVLCGEKSKTMGEITNDSIEQYLSSLLPERDAVLREMEEEAARRHIPIVGPAVGRVLYQLAQMMGAKTVFEMGSAIGYSTIWWARAVGAAGRVVYTDGSASNATEARRYFERAGVASRVHVCVGDALELLSERKEQYDVVFNDVDKQDYPRVLGLALPRVRTGGLFISDNALWHGRVGEALKADDTATRGILDFNKLIYGNADLFTTILPLRDGLAVCLKR